MTEYDELMKEALTEAGSCQSDVPVGCVMSLNGEIIGRGYNQRELLKDPSAHAEIVCMREAAQRLGTWRLDGTVICCTLEPCPMCAEAIIQARVATVVFGAYDLLYGATGSAFNLFSKGRSFPIPKVVGGVLDSDCKRLLKQFFKEMRRRP